MDRGIRITIVGFNYKKICDIVELLRESNLCEFIDEKPAEKEGDFALKELIIV
jgi:hypothetical protein